MMKIFNALIVVTLTTGGLNNASAQTPKSYQEMCVQKQVKLHEKLKDISPDNFRSFCDCTYRELSSTLNQEKLDELQKNNKKPAWLKPAEDAAGKACLKPETKLQA